MREQRLQQYQPHSLEDHLANGRPWDLDRTSGGLLILQPFTGGEEEGFAEGNADALWRHRRLIGEFGADVVLVVSADAVYALDYRDMIDAHLESDADVTMVTSQVKDDDPGRFGVVSVGCRSAGHPVRLQARRSPERPGHHGGVRLPAQGPARRPGRPGRGRRAPGRLRRRPAAPTGRRRSGLRAPARGEWRDVGTPQSYWQAHQDLVDGNGLDLDDLDWRIRTTAGHRPPARVAAGASVEDSLISPACRVARRVSRSVLSPGVVVEAGAVVEDSRPPDLALKQAHVAG